MTTRPFTSYDVLKLLALVAMTADHVGAFLFPDAMWLRVVGRLAAPLFCFLVGWNGSYRFRRELLGAALLVTVLDLAYRSLFPLNILWVILLGRALMEWMDRRAKPESPTMIITVLLVWILSFALVEYGALALLWMLWGRAAHKQPGSHESWVYAGASFVIGLGFTCVLMQYTSAAQYTVTALLFGLMLFGLQRFQLREYPGMRLPGARFLARHALEYYVLHRAAIFVLGTVYGTVVPALRWF